MAAAGDGKSKSVITDVCSRSKEDKEEEGSSSKRKRTTTKPRPTESQYWSPPEFDPLAPPRYSLLGEYIASGPNDPRGSPKGPRVPPFTNAEGIFSTSSPSAHKLVDIALSCFNETQRAHQRPEYELLEILGIIIQIIASVYHMNFTARPKNAARGAQEEDKLFFAEVRYESEMGSKICACVRVLGPPGTLTGLRRCRLMCKHNPDLIQHPKGGGYTNKIKFP